ncbi:MAG: FHA domain-containing protein [Dehalococcoidia bacterium]
MTIEARHDTPEAAEQAPGDVPGEVESPDIYGLLGVRPDASRLLAREMYWARIQPLLDPGRRDDPDARATIEALNDALAIIIDEERRADYDAVEAAPAAGAGRAAERRSAHPALRAAWRSFLFTGLVAVSALVGATISWEVAATAAGLAVAVPLLVALVARMRRPRAGPLERLGLIEGATRHDLDVAYRARAQELLVRLGSDPRALEGLNHLDRDYLAAMRALMAPGASRRRPRLPRLPAVRLPARALPVSAALALTGRALRPAGRAGAWIARTSMTATRRSIHAARASMSARRADRGAGTEHRAHREHTPRGATPAAPPLAAPAAPPPVDVTRERTGAPPSRNPWRAGRAPVAPVETPLIDLEQRLAASLKASALEIARSTPPVEPPSTAEAEAPSRSAAHLLLFASAGVRRVPIQDRPLRIGSAAGCDLVLPARDGVSGEHALVWRHGDTVVLHVTDPGAECHVNGKPSTWAMLEDGDELAVGKARLRIEIQASA